jgi:heme/copper-type cytochrome/quinol oxidase subunit 2
LLQHAINPRQGAEKEKKVCKVPTMQTSNALDPQARAIYELAVHSTIILALIFVIITGAIIYAVFRFRARPGEPNPRQTGPTASEKMCYSDIINKERLTSHG